MRECTGKVVSCLSRPPLYASRQSRGLPMRKMSFRATGSDTALQTRIREGKSKEIRMARGGGALRYTLYVLSSRMRPLASLSSVFLSVFLSSTSYLSCASLLRHFSEEIESPEGQRGGQGRRGASTQAEDLDRALKL